MTELWKFWAFDNGWSTDRFYSITYMFFRQQYYRGAKRIILVHRHRAMITLRNWTIVWDGFCRCSVRNIAKEKSWMPEPMQNLCNSFIRFYIHSDISYMRIAMLLMLIRVGRLWWQCPTITAWHADQKQHPTDFGICNKSPASFAWKAAR